MTPDVWFTATNPNPLLNLMGMMPQSIRWPRDPGVDRRSRLTACAFARQVWGLLTTDAQSAVHIAEQYAEGHATRSALAASGVSVPEVPTTPEQFALRAAAWASTGTYHPYWQTRGGTVGDAPMMDPSPVDAALNAAKALAEAAAAAIPHRTTLRWSAAWYVGFDAARRIQADIVRDICPPPGVEIAIDPSWLTSTVRALARQMDETGDFSAVPILADALQDAGCENETLLQCCRAPGNVHVRGNWVVDLVLHRP